MNAPATAPPKYRAEDALKFIEHWIAIHGCPILVTAIKPDEAPIGKYSNAENFLHWMEQSNKQGHNIYFSINVVPAGISKKASADDITQVVSFSADLDADKDKNRAEELERLEKQIETDLPLRPSIVVDSGNGYWAYWLLDKPTTDKQRSVRLLTSITQKLKSDPSVKNVDRIARVPGTINWPTPSKVKAGYAPCESRTIKLGDERYSIEEIEAAFSVQNEWISNTTHTNSQKANTQPSSDQRAKGSGKSKLAERRWLMKVLEFLHPDSMNRDDWLKVIAALVYCGYEDLAWEWAEKSEQNDPQDPAKTITSLRDGTAPDNPVKLGTIRKLATDAGYKLDDGIKPVDIGLMLASSPPEQRFLLKDDSGIGIFPTGHNCGMAGAGGVGKSTLVVQLGVSIAGGRLSFLDRFRASAPQHVYYFMAEDDEPEFHRRLKAVLGELERDVNPEHWPSVLDNLREHLHIYPVAGQRVQLTVATRGGEFAPGAAVDLIAEHIKDTGGLVILDPLRRFTDGEETNASLSAVIQAMDEIRLGVQECYGVEITPLVIHHTSKESARGSMDDQGAFRGGTALVDGLRFAMVMTSLPEKEAEKYDNITADEAKNIRLYSFAKFNYGAKENRNAIKWVNGCFREQELNNDPDRKRELAKYTLLKEIRSKQSDPQKFSHWKLLVGHHKTVKWPQKEAKELLDELADDGYLEKIKDRSPIQITAAGATAADAGFNKWVGDDSLPF